MAYDRRSPLEDRHRALGATITPFGGWDMPLDYGSVLAEHQAVRTACGVFDLSHLGSLRVTGAGAERAVQRAFSNDVGALGVGRAHYSLCLNDQAGITDDLLVYRLPSGIFVVPNASNTDAVLESLRTVADDDATVSDVKEELVCLAVQGPNSAAILQAVGIPVAGMEYLDCREAEGRGVLARSGYTGELGFEVFLPPEHAPILWDRLLDAGAAPVGLGARDTLRLEMGYPLHGNDITRSTTPVEARLGWAVKPSNRLDIAFRGRDAYLAAKEAGPRRRLWGLRTVGRGIPRAHCDVLHDGQVVGETTSGTFSPTLRLGLAMGYLRADIEPGAGVEIVVRGKSVAAEVVRPPFVDADPKR